MMSRDDIFNAVNALQLTAAKLVGIIDEATSEDGAGWDGASDAAQSVLAILKSDIKVLQDEQNTE